MYLEIFLADFAVFRVFFGISRKYLNFAGLRPREISEALYSHVLGNPVRCTADKIQGSYPFLNQKFKDL